MALRFAQCFSLLHSAWILSLAGPYSGENHLGHFPILKVPHPLPRPPQTQPTTGFCLEHWVGEGSPLLINLNSSFGWILPGCHLSFPPAGQDYTGHVPFFLVGCHGGAWDQGTGQGQYGPWILQPGQWGRSFPGSETRPERLPLRVMRGGV